MHSDAVERMEMRRWRDLTVDDLLTVRPWRDAHELEERGRAIEQDGDEWNIATVDGEAVAWVVPRWHGKRSNPEWPVMEDLYVKESWRGHGIGTALIHFVEEEARRRGHSKIRIAVNPTRNARARALYERLGYEHTGGPAYLDGVYDGDEDWVIDLEKRL
jgi:GNAT superfamily N-acetyltransferase